MMTVDEIRSIASYCYVSTPFDISFDVDLDATSPDKVILIAYYPVTLLETDIRSRINNRTYINLSTASESAILVMLKKIAYAIVMHEIEEQFRYKDAAIFNPHDCSGFFDILKDDPNKLLSKDLLLTESKDFSH